MQFESSVSNNVDEKLLTRRKNDSKIILIQICFNDIIIRKEEKIKSIQSWIPIDSIYDNGIIKSNKNKYVKIIKVIPINFNLKTQLEKNSILNSYKIFLKSCNFDIQILIQSKKEDLYQHIQNIKNSEKEKNQIMKNYLEDYINFIKEKNNTNKSSSKNIYLIIKNKNIKNNFENLEENIFQELNEKYLKIKDNLARCGNYVFECSKEETIKILFSFLNSKKFLDRQKEE